VKIDKQREMVYKWERQYVAPHDTTPVSFANIENIIRYIWSEEGWDYPPMVELLPKNCTTISGDATRTIVRFEETTYSWIIIHEISHVLTSTHDNRTNKHGSLFMGMYLHLLSKYLHVNYATLLWSAVIHGLKVSHKHTPVWSE